MNWDFTLDTHIEVVDSRTIRGYRHSMGWSPEQHVYFQTRFSRPFDSFEMDTSAIITMDKGRIGTATIARFNFNTHKDEEILVTTALSGVSMEGAALNMEKEAPKDDFDYYYQQAVKKWDNQFGKIEVSSEDGDLKTVFYTALYHAMLAPTLYSDVDGKYFGPDGKIHQAEDWDNYSTFSLWDTFRASHPLFTYIEPERVNDMIECFLHFYEQSGALPLWNLYGWETNMMIGYHAVPVIVDAYLKGVGNFDAEKALEACIASANRDDYHGIGFYKTHGYVPSDKENWSLSKTMEYAYDDYCIAKMAEAMGKSEIAETFYRRSQNYKNTFNPASSFMQPRDSKGNFMDNYDPEEYIEDICESNGWQYYWYVPHDIDGLISLTGGVERFGERLDSMFTYEPTDRTKLPIFSTGMIGQYAHGNEPGHHIIYLFNRINQPWKTQKYAAEVMRSLYTNEPSGLCGNEDCGQMSSWYVFSALGFYPVDPISGRYEIGSPLFPEAKLHLGNGKTFTIIAHNAGEENPYIQSVHVNGKPYDKSYITHQMIMQGDTVSFEMGNQPGPVWYKDND